MAAAARAEEVGPMLGTLASDVDDDGTGAVTTLRAEPSSLCDASLGTLAEVRGAETARRC